MKQVPIILFFLGLFTLAPMVSAQQGKVIRGTIADSETKERIIGATVTEYDRDNRIIGGTISDPNGNFVLNVKSTENVFRVSFFADQDALLARLETTDSVGQHDVLVWIPVPGE